LRSGHERLRRIRHDTPPIARLRGGVSRPDHRGHLWRVDTDNCLEETV
jgi:hypothetical protein